MATARKSTASKSKAIEVEFEFERATKTTYRFQEVTDEDRGIVGTLYVSQKAFGGKEPKGLTVTINPS
jgi:hypothetical protein